MNVANPVYTAFAIDSASPAQRPTGSSLMQMSRQETRGVSRHVQNAAGLSAVFPTMIGCCLLATSLIYAFFVRSRPARRGPWARARARGTFAGVGRASASSYARVGRAGSRGGRIGC
jgi:hypothetical protein